jgi:hypothetical protein
LVFRLEIDLSQKQVSQFRSRQIGTYYPAQYSLLVKIIFASGLDFSEFTTNNRWCLQFALA